jgi:Fur family peroxide stress response transcriptional regulator
MLDDSIVERLRVKGVVLTPQRLAVVEFLKKTTSHPTVEDIYKKLKKKYPTMSQATVYTTMELLLKIGEVRKLTIRKNKACFDPNPKPHHHFFCQRCGRIFDIEVSCPISKVGSIENSNKAHCPVLKTTITQGHKVEGVRAYLYGICASCLKEI